MTHEMLEMNGDIIHGSAAKSPKYVRKEAPARKPAS